MKLEKNEYTFDVFYCKNCDAHRPMQGPDEKYILGMSPGSVIPYNLCEQCGYPDHDGTLYDLEVEPIARVIMEVSRNVVIEAASICGYEGDKAPETLNGAWNEQQLEDFTMGAHDAAFEADHDNDSEFKSSSHVGWKLQLGEKIVLVLTCGDNTYDCNYDHSSYDDDCQSAMRLEGNEVAGDVYSALLLRLGLKSYTLYEWEPLGDIAIALIEEAKRGHR